jgi:hypothetical protein
MTQTTGATDDNNNLEPIPSSVHGLTQEEDSLVARMEDIIQFFLDLLQVTGGNLAPDKCAWYLIGNRWNKGVPTLVQIEPQHQLITMTLRSSGKVQESNGKHPQKDTEPWFFFMTGDFLKAHTTCPAWRMAHQQLNYHTKNVKMSNGQ